MRDLKTKVYAGIFIRCPFRVLRGGACVLMLLAVSMIFMGCSGYNQLLKSGTIDQKYTEAFKLYDAGKYPKAITLFTNILPNLQGASQEDTILFHVGMAHYKRGDWEMSSQYFNEYRNKFARTGYTRNAEYYYAMSFYNLSLNPEKDQTQTRLAISSFNEYMNRYPSDTANVDIEQRVEDLNAKLYQKTFLNSALYYKLGHYNSAITALKTALKENPEIPYRAEMMYLITRSWYDYARGSMPSLQQDRYLKMIDSYFNFKMEYPEDSKFGKQLDQLYEQAKRFTDKHSQKAGQMSEDKIIELRQRIYDCQDKLFDTKVKAERIKLREQIKVARKGIAAQKRENRADSKEINKDKEAEIKIISVDKKKYKQKKSK